LNRIRDYSDIVGIWAMINTNVYPFTNSEKELIEKINVVYNLIYRHINDFSNN